MRAATPVFAAAVIAAAVALSVIATAQEFSVPEETLISYLRLTYHPISLGDHRDVIDRWYCGGYSLLAEETRARMSLPEFVAAWWFIRVSSGYLDNVIVQTVTYNDTRTIAKIAFTYTLNSWVWGIVRRTDVATLIKEANAIWRIRLSEEGIQNLLEAGRRSGARHTPACALPTARPFPAPTPAVTPTPTVTSSPTP